MRSGNADANVGGLDHGDVVGAIADRESDGLLVALDEINDHGLLQWRHTTADDRLTRAADVEKGPLQRRRERMVKCHTRDHQSVA